MMRIPDDTTILSDGLTLTALTLGDADEMTKVLHDERLHEFTSGSPMNLEELKDRYQRLVNGSSRQDEFWLNWIVRTLDGRAIGTMQATIVASDDGASLAYVAWVIGSAWQAGGFATEAARSLVSWLRGLGVDTIEAHVHRDHHASATVARRAGFLPTSELIDGEIVWRQNE
jgi:RimJ/RimL family protein N-acetyltransferase